VATYYASPSGSDTTGDGSLGNPWRTAAKGLTALTPGDTLRLRAGTYAEALADSIPSGNSGAHVTVAAYPGEQAVLRAPDGSAAGVRLRTGKSYVTLGSTDATLVIDGSAQAAGNTSDGVKIDYAGSGTISHHVRLQGVEITGWGGNGVLSTQDPDTSNVGGFNELLACHVHGNGVPLSGASHGAGHGVYLETSDNTVSDCDLHDNGQYGVQIYRDGAAAGDAVNCARNTVTRNRLYANGFGLHSDGSAAEGGGVTCWYGDANVLTNNLCYGNAGGGVLVDSGASNTQVLHNTCQGNQGQGTYHGVELGNNGAVTGTVVKGNVASGNTAGDYHASAGSTPSTTSDYNLTGDATGVGTHTLRSTDPLFAGVAGGDFRLQASSPARDAGVTPALVAVDLAGHARPYGTAPDLGCYEYYPSGGRRFASQPRGNAYRLGGL
jgi:parallel beta-helix repeat protein